MKKKVLIVPYFSSTCRSLARAKFLVIAIVLLVTLSISSNAQILTEDFEGAGWVIGGTNVGTTIGGAGPTNSTANSSWRFSAISVCTGTTFGRTGKGVQVRSTSSSYLITPVITGGVTQVTVWVYPTSATAQFNIGIATNTTATSLSSSFSNPAATSTVTGIWTLSNFSAGLNMTSGQWNQLTFTANVPVTQDALVKFQRISSGSVNIDDVVVTGAAATPTIGATTSSLSFANTTELTNSASQTFNITGNFLTGFPGDITVSAPNTDFQVSNDNSTWGASTTIAYTSATLSATPVYVRFSPQTQGAKSGNVTFSGGGAATPPTVAVSGTGVGPIYNYRSKQTGNWADASTWQYDNGGWIDAVTAPTDADGTITIQNGHIVTAAANVSVDQVTVNIGGVLEVGTGVVLTVANGTGTDVIVNGKLTNKSLTLPILTGTVEIGSGGEYTVDANVPNSYNLPSISFLSGSLLNILQGAPRLPQTVGGNVTWNSIGTGSFVNSATNTVSGTLTIANGFINNGSGGTGRTLTVGNLVVQGGEYSVSGTGATGTNTLNVDGDITVSGGTLYASAAAGGTGIINVKGNVSHTAGVFGTLTGTTNGTVNLNAASAQSFATTGLSNAVNITIGAASTPSVTFTTDVTVNTGGTLLITAGSLTIAASKVLTVAGTANFNDKSVTLASTVAGTASIAAVTGTLSNATNVTTQTYIPGGRRAYRFLGHPFTGALTMASLIDDIYVTGAGAGFDATATNNPSAAWFDPTATAPGAWTAFASTSDASWTQYRGIRALVRGDRSQPTTLTGGNPTPNAATIDLTGSLNSGAVNIPLSTVNSYYLVSNPYPSPVDIGTVISSASNLGTQYWVWDANALTRGAYVTKTIGGGAYNLAMNGAFVVIPTGGASSLSFAESNKAATATASLFRTNNAKQKQLELELQYNNYYADNMFVRFNKDAQTAFEQNDGGKLINQDANMYTLSADGKKLSLDARPFDVDATIPMGFTTTVVGTYKVKVVDNGLDRTMEVYLKDKMLNTLTKLDIGAEYSFSVTADAATQGESRFELVMKQAPAVLVPLASTFSIKLSPNPATDVVKVIFSNEGKAATTISIVNAEGKTVSTVNAGDVQSGTVDINVKGLAKGSYFVTLSNGKEKKTEKLQVQ